MTKYYVSKTGNNTTGLSEATALRTIQAGLNKLSAGDVLAIYPGIYVEQVSISANGTETNPIRIYGVGARGEVVLDGRADADGLNTGLPTGSFAAPISRLGRKFKYAPLFYVHGNWTTVENITIKRSLGRGIQFGDTIAQNNGEPIISSTCVGGRLIDVHVISTRAAGINYYGTQNTKALRCTVRDASNFISGTDTASQHAGGFVWRGSFDFEAEYCDIYESWGEGFMVDARDGNSKRGLLKGCRAWDIGTVTCYLHAVQDVEINGCYFFETPGWNPTRDTRIGTTQGLHLRVMEQQTYDFGSRNFLKNIYIHHTKCRNVMIGLGGPLSSTNTAQGMENVRVEDCEFVRTDGLSTTINVRNTHTINGSFKRNRIITNSSDVVANDSFFQEWNRANNTWNKNPGAGNLGTGDAIDAAMTETDPWPGPEDGGPLPPDIPPAPTNLVASETTTSSISIAWNDNATDEYKYTVERRPSSQYVYSQIAVLGPNITSYVDDDVVAGGHYYYRVYATNAIGNSGYSNELDVYAKSPDPAPVAPAAPTNLNITTYTSSTVDMTWADNSNNEDKFNIKRSVGVNDQFMHLDSVAANVTSFRDTTVEPGTKYYYRIQAQNDAGISAFSNIMSVTTPDSPDPEGLPHALDIPLNEGDPYVYVLDKNFNTLAVIDDYDTLIWAENHYEAGKFELHLPQEYANDPNLEDNNYLILPISETVMVIRDKKIIDGVDNNSFIVTGRDATILFTKRFMAEEETFMGKADLLMKNLVYYNCAFPSNHNRKMPDILPPVLVSEFDVDFNDQMKYQTVYDALVKMSKATDLGFRLKIVESDGALKFKFELYDGTDRSVDQTDVQPVIFAEEFGNVLSSSFATSVADDVTFVYVVSDDPVFPLLQVWYDGRFPISEPVNLDRIEHVLEVTISRTVQGQPDLTDQEVYTILLNKGREYLKNHRPRGIFDGDYDIATQFIYGVDFFMGDIVSVLLYGQEAKVRVIELIKSYTAEGIKTYAAFEYVY